MFTILSRMGGTQWTSKGAMVLSGTCLLAGIAGGWAIRGTNDAGISPAAKIPAISAAMSGDSAAAPHAPAQGELKQIADNQAAPLLARLQADPNNPDLLTSIANDYYDAQQYPIAAAFYGRVLKARPTDAAVRTDLGTAYWYMGNPDAALTEFKQALVDAPDNANTLFNLGLVRWKGKADVPGALAAWKRLLAVHPEYQEKSKVEQMMVEVQVTQGSPTH